MNADKQDNRLDQLIHTAIAGNSTPFEFKRWKQEHPREVTEFQSEVEHPESQASVSLKTRRTMIRTLKLAAAALIVIGVCLGLPHLGRHDSRNTVFAQIVEQIEQAKVITWRLTFCNHVTSKDGRRTWVEAEAREMAYRAPGLYREVLHPTLHGGVEHTTITDAVNLKSLSLVPAEKRARLQELAVTTEDPQGPFRWAREHMSKPDLEWVGKRMTATGEVNVFRRAFKQPSDNQDWSYDFWVDAKTKRLVGIQVPGADIYDPETDPARENPIEKDWSTITPACYVQSEINFDAELDDSLFSLEPPAGYAVQTEHHAQVTEQEMVSYLGIMAEYNNETFPDQPYSIDSARLNEINEKPKQDRTAAEQKLRDTVDHYKMASLNMMPTAHFIEDHAVKGSFRYLGKGVRLGDKDRIVCWYRLKDAVTCRVVYGDLSIKDMPADDLPLPVEP
jgi:hypothetical protein